jgi:peptide/nickel transport system substrate-binding protein
MIPSPTALKKCDGTKPPRECSFNLNAIGAGPFMLESFKPGDSITLVRNPNYWGGQVYLDRLVFVTFNDGGGDLTGDALKNGTVQGAYVRIPQTVAAIHDANFEGFSTIEQAAEFQLLNAGVNVTCAGGKPEPLCVGKPDGPTPTNPITKDLRIRQAIAAAIDPKVINDRVFQGKGLTSADLFQKSFPWDPGVPGPKYDPEAAKKLVSEAKSSGWDGKLRLLFSDSPALREEGVAVQTMLRAVGMEPELLTPPGTTYQTVVTSTKDFDLSTWGASIGPDDSAIWALTQNLDSKSPSNRTGFSSPKVEQALRSLRTATTDDQKRAAYKAVAEEVNAHLPWVTKLAKETFSAFGAKVHGVTGGIRCYVFFDKAWIEK